MSLTIPAAALTRAIERITPHVCEDDSLPALNGLRLEIRSDWLIVTATDRFTMAFDRFEVATSYEANALLRRADIPAVQAWLDRLDGDATVRVTVDVQGEDSVLTLKAGCEQIRVAAPTRHVNQYPAWRKMLAKLLDQDVEQVPLTCFTTRYLSRFEAAGRIVHAWQTAPRSPLFLATDGGNFLGLVMPVRVEDKTPADILSDWMPMLCRTADVDGATYDLDAIWSDKDGDPWQYSGADNDRGEPLMAVVGIDTVPDDRVPLVEVVALYGPLTRAVAR
ncbi:phiSA1p31-related protein [Kitasatospora sp. NPDC059571]|uniref:DNA polymerase III subunit beta family protein n=1 Tax=Kitasatospora sp. NPDC059571 TaxID=3346871 RepID=UPI00369AD2DB